MHRSLVLLALAVAIGLASFFLLRSGAPAAADESNREGEAKAAPLTRGGQPPAPTELDEVAAGEVQRTAELERNAGAPAVLDEPASDRIVLVGRVVDTNDAPLLGALVQLGSYKAWGGDGPEPPTLASFRGIASKGRPGYETKTDADGRFRFEVPVPTARSVSLYIDAGRFTASSLTHFVDGPRSDGPLVAGVRDVGTIRLGATGSILGRVVDVRGAPVAGAEVRGGKSISSIIGQTSETTAEGTFVIGHAPVGTYGVIAKKEGFVSHFDGPYEIEVGRETGPVDFVLEDAPSIRGRVIDETGAPISGVRIGGWPSGAGSWSDTKSASDGTFILSLPQAIDYTLGAKLKGYETWGNSDDRSVVYPPGTRDIVIEMRKRSSTAYVIVDDLTGEPIETFASQVVENNGSQSTVHIFTQWRWQRAESHPGGQVRLTGRAGADLVVIQAPGYLESTFDLDDPSEDGAAIEVRMKASATIVGRAVMDGHPVAGAKVRAAFGSVLRGSFRPREKTAVEATTGADGSFSLALRSGGAHRLTISGAEGASATLDGVAAPSGETTDVGDVECVLTGSIEGIVLTPPGIEPESLTVTLGDWRSGVTSETNSKGIFRFDGVPPGEHMLRQNGRSGILGSTASTMATVESGKVTNVTLDASAMGLVPITLTILVDTKPLEGVSVSIEPVDRGTQESGAQTASSRLGVTDAAGRVKGTSIAYGEAAPKLHLPGGAWHQDDSHRLQLDYGTPVEATLQLKTASLSFELPAGVAVPEAGQLLVALAPAEGTEGGCTSYVTLRGGSPVGEDATLVSLSNGVWTVGGLPEGRFDVTVYATRAGAPNVRTPVGENTFRVGPERAFEVEGSVQLEVGKTRPVTFH